MIEISLFPLLKKNDNGGGKSLPFLSTDFSMFIISIAMAAVSAGTYFLNIMINDIISKFLLIFSRITAIAIMVSYVVFFVGFFVKYIQLLNQHTVFLAVYIFFSVSCFFCNFTEIVFADGYRDSYNIFYNYAYNYLDEHPEDETLSEDDLAHKYKVKLYLLSMLHIISVIVMIFYYKAANLYVQYKKRKADPDSIDISSCTHSTGFTTNKNTYGSNTNCVSSVQSLKGSNPSLKGSNNNLKGSNSNIKGSNTSVKGSNTALYTANDNTMNTSTFKGSNPRLYN